MPRYELRETCLFVDAYKLEKKPKDPKNPETKRDRYPKDIDCAHVMDKGPCLETADKSGNSSKSLCPYTKLNDVAAFIGHFIVMGVETDFLLPQIIASEYGWDPEKAAAEVKIVYKLMENCLQPRTQPVPPPVSAASPGAGEHSGNYKLDFSVNPMGIGIFKG